MGRRSWEEVRAPLPGRRSLVISRADGPVLEGVEWVRSFDDAVARARQTDPDPRVIGGAAIFTIAMPHATRVELTEVHRKVEADTYFRLNRAPFQEIARRRGQEDTSIEFVTLERRGWIERVADKRS
jgi:dihydrofolate reductase